MIKVLHPGIFTTIQDLGRSGFQAFGVPLAGAMDEYSCRVANLLVGNEEKAPVLELTMSGGSYEFLQDTLIAITGAQMAAQLDDRILANWNSYLAKKGERLTFSFAKQGCRAYLAVAGGFNVKKVMGSASTYTRSKMGGVEGRALRQDDVLQILPSGNFEEKSLPEDFQLNFSEQPIIRVLPGPQDDAFVDEALTDLQNSTYQIEPDSDRMGYRLSGTVLRHKKTADIISDALFKGAVQVPGNGQPIIMLSDCQTTGGYTKLCFVITPDLDVLAQCKPGDKIKFAVVDEVQAAEIYVKYRKKLDDVRIYLKNPSVLAKQLDIKVNGIQYKVEIKEIEV